jgi:hypothetical protein
LTPKGTGYILNIKPGKGGDFMPALFKVLFKKDKQEREFDVFAIQRIYNFSINDQVLPLDIRKMNTTEFLSWDGQRFIWINSDDCILKKEK